MKHLVRTTAIVFLLSMTLGAAAAQPEPFTNWQQGFESGTEGWITGATPGEEGWCGVIEHRTATSGTVEPSEGEGYAVVRHGECNEYWTEAGWEASGPTAAGAGFPRTWPEDGYTSELDVYLDPEAGTEFTYAGSVFLLDPEDPDDPFRYFFIPVTHEGDSLSVLGQEVTEPGWYMFRYTFGDEDGNLTVNAELLRDGEIIASELVTMTAFSNEPTSSFDVNELGSGYTWFESIADDTELAIDEHRVRASN